MSYILDALRRADSERERGRVPGLHAQTATATADDDDLPDGRGGMRWGFVASLLGLALIVVFAWMAFGRDKPIEVIVSAPPPPQPMPAPPPPAPVAMAQAPVAAPAPAPVPESVAAPTPAPAAARTAAAPEKPQRKPVPAKREPARVATPPVDETPAVPVSELPADVRRELPTLAISGATYSASRASRMLIVNGQLYHEGDIIAPNVHLEQIRLKSAVLRYKNYRYSVGY
jgi:general secretion pathway protein B